MRAWPLSMSVPLLQRVPSNPKTRPMESTARQKVAVGHDTEVSPEASVPESGGSVAMAVGAEKAEPFHVKTSPALSTAIQKAGLGHETELSWPCGSASLGWVHECPFHTDGPPSTATQNEGEAQEIRWPFPGSDVARPAGAVVDERVALAVDGDAERGGDTRDETGAPWRPRW